MTWLGPVDVRGLGELDGLVEFARGRVRVYSGRGRGGEGGGGSGGSGGEGGAGAGAAADDADDGTNEKDRARPPRGQRLNAPAILTLRNIRPKKSGGDAGGGVAGSPSESSDSASSSSSLPPSSTTTIPSSLSFEAKLRATAERAGWTHVHYDAERGVWVVKVAGF